jgi:predicted Zn finger-like uncharacterized protein
MSLITRCPACGTMFKVVPDQLRISEGWVRCGHCADVFDAAAHLQRDAPPTESEVPANATVPKAQPAPARIAEAAPESEAFASSLTTEIGEGYEEPDSAQIDAEAQALVEHPLDQPFELRRRDDGEVELSIPPRSARQPDFDDDSDSEAGGEADPGPHQVSFVRKARRNELWAAPRVRAALLLAAFALAVLLAAQVAFQERDRLAVATPVLRPWLAMLCEPLNCRIGAPRHIDAIAIDSSSFNKLRGDAYRLNVTLRNQSRIEVAMPALELTLTDGQDQAVVRRVLLPAELGPGASVIAAASDWSGSLALAVAANGTGARVAGYRLLAFYP